MFSKQGSTPTLGRGGSARPNPKMGASDPENPLFLGFSVLRGGLRPWSWKGPDHGVGVDPETVNCSFWVCCSAAFGLFALAASRKDRV